LPLWLLTVSIALEEVATADLFRTIALDVMDVNRTEVDVVGPKLEGEEGKKKLLLVMMLQLMMPMVLQLRNMALLLMMLMVLQLMMLMVPQLMMLMVPQLKDLAKTMETTPTTVLMFP